MVHVRPSSLLQLLLIGSQSRKAHLDLKKVEEDKSMSIIGQHLLAYKFSSHTPMLDFHFIDGWSR